MPSPDLEQSLDALFAGPPEQFLPTRDALAKQLKTAGDKAGSARVKGLHKPTQAAQALNRLAREARPELDELFEAGRQLAGGKDFKAALDRQRSALEAVFKKATGPDVPAIMTVVRGAQVDPALAERVKQGRFSKLPEVQAGFFGVAAAPTAALAGPPPPAPEEAAPARAKDEADRAEQASPGEADRATGEAERRGEGEPPPDAAGRADADRATRERSGEAERLDREAESRAEAERLEREALRSAEAERLERELREAEREAATLEVEAAQAEREAIEKRRRADQAAERVAKLKIRH